MNRSGRSQQWPRHRLIYAATLVPFLIAFVGAAYILATEAVYLVAIFLLLYAGVNVFQAGCCIGCPYRGRFCPAIFGIYLANLLSITIYKNRIVDQRFFRRNANLAEAFLVATILFPTYWLAISNWVYLVGFAALVGLHAVTFFATICTRCAYHTICPSGRIAAKFNK